MTKLLFTFLLLFASGSTFANDQCANIIEAQYCDVLGDEDAETGTYCGGYDFTSIEYLEAYQKNESKNYFGKSIQFDEDGFTYKAQYDYAGYTDLEVVLVDMYCTILRKEIIRSSKVP